jgi:hypothetical protein
MASFSQTDLFMQCVTQLVVRVFSLLLISPDVRSSNLPHKHRQTFTRLHGAKYQKRVIFWFLVVIYFNPLFIWKYSWDAGICSSVFMKCDSEFWYYSTARHPENNSWRQRLSHLDYSVCARVCFQTVVYFQQLVLTALYQAFRFLFGARNNSSMKLLLGLCVYIEATYI